MLLVEVEKPENEALGSWFSELRNWLDVNHCEPLAFARAGRRVDRLIYRISFEKVGHAKAFAKEFARYLPTVRRANAFERTQLQAMEASPVEALS